LVLLAVCDARYCFTLIDVGQCGSNNDSGVLANSDMGKGFKQNLLKLPRPETLHGCEYDPLPYYLVGDEIFPLKTWMMRPYPGKLDEEQRIFNYRLSRARRVIENSFGIMTARWRIFTNPIKASVSNCEKYTMACIALHNYLGQTDNASYCPSGFVDSENGCGEIRQGKWRREIKICNGIVDLPNVRGSRYKEDAVNMRDSLKHYLNNEGKVSWQVDHVRRT